MGFIHFFVLRVRPLCLEGRFYDRQPADLLDVQQRTAFCDPIAVSAGLAEGSYSGLADAWMCQPEVVLGVTGPNREYCSGWPAQ